MMLVEVFYRFAVPFLLILLLLILDSIAKRLVINDGHRSSSRINKGEMYGLRPYYCKATTDRTLVNLTK